ncbi:TMEM165/GDT1 family protein [Qipengyuania sp. 902]|uniref:TMEM165/GDT1 family protein n=1 Tax=Qipengyuania sp. 902 TaxID=3417565 RepID=UPI003EBC0145
MTSFLFAMVASFLAATGSRDQLLVAHLRERLGGSYALLLLAITTAIATAFIAAWFGGTLAGQLSSDAATMFVAIAMLLAAVECAWPNRARTPQEPTRSLGAIGIVLFLRQLTDSSRFLIAAFAAALASPMLAASGGAIGGAAAVCFGWFLGGKLEHLPLRLIRLCLAAVLFLLAVWIGLTARGLIG